MVLFVWAFQQAKVVIGFNLQAPVCEVLLLDAVFLSIFKLSFAFQAAVVYKSLNALAIPIHCSDLMELALMGIDGVCFLPCTIAGKGYEKEYKA